MLELPGVMTYGSSPDHAKAKVQALALQVVADQLEQARRGRSGASQHLLRRGVKQWPSTWAIQREREGPFDKRSADEPRPALRSDAPSFLGLLSRQSTTPTDVLSQRRSAARATSLRMQLPPDARRTRRTGPTNGRRVSRVKSLPGARLPRRTHPEVSGVVPRAARRRSVGSGFTARVARPPNFATMMHRPCDASRCFQTDRFGQRVP